MKLALSAIILLSTLLHSARADVTPGIDALFIGAGESLLGVKYLALRSRTHFSFGEADGLNFGPLFVFDWLAPDIQDFAVGATIQMGDPLFFGVDFSYIIRRIDNFYVSATGRGWSASGIIGWNITDGVRILLLLSLKSFSSGIPTELNFTGLPMIGARLNL